MLIYDRKRVSVTIFHKITVIVICDASREGNV